jgi:hypothetical protein
MSQPSILGPLAAMAEEEFDVKRVSNGPWQETLFMSNCLV